MVELEVQPIVDVLRGADLQLKRAAIEMLGRDGRSDAAFLLRGLLADPDIDVRGQAAVALSRLENAHHRRLIAAVSLATKHPQTAEYQAEVGHQSYRYAGAGLVDLTSQRYTLLQARDALKRALSLKPSSGAWWLELARVQMELQETSAAWSSLSCGLSRGPQTADGYLLGMEMAFQERRWDRMLAFAQEGRGTPAPDGEIQELFGWWAECRPRAPGGVT